MPSELISSIGGAASGSNVIFSGLHLLSLGKNVAMIDDRNSFDISPSNSEIINSAAQKFQQRDELDFGISIGEQAEFSFRAVNRRACASLMASSRSLSSKFNTKRILLIVSFVSVMILLKDLSIVVSISRSAPGRNEKT